GVDLLNTIARGKKDGKVEGAEREKAVRTEDDGKDGKEVDVTEKRDAAEKADGDHAMEDAKKEMEKGAAKDASKEDVKEPKDGDAMAVDSVEKADGADKDKTAVPSTDTEKVEADDRGGIAVGLNLRFDAVISNSIFVVQPAMENGGVTSLQAAR
ncbi:hypothetical protein HK101_010206, partial [Irineochytrium annulatum]